MLIGELALELMPIDELASSPLMEDWDYEQSH